MIGGVAEIEYVGATRTPAELRATIDVILAEGSGHVGSESGRALDDWAALKTGIDVRVGGAGFDPMTVAVVVAFAPAANHVVTSLWDEVILPRLRRKLGDDALGRERKRK